ncbi:hypothetical protein D9613_005183 [Agrocybe pediades]|uniref:Uncharacterized protein n=1 Tax=Agrocybe pediades TaxID=84607 RepID=A0A8H4QYJ5_9AGAR|nr:hypothetical protein D9613_005183 [Agrocybe pediades]
MSYNNAPILLALEDSNSGSSISRTNKPIRTPERSEPCLPSRLPTTSFIRREAEDLAPKELVKQMLTISMQEEMVKEVVESQEEREAPQSPSSSMSRRSSSIRSFVKSMVSPRLGRAPVSGWANLQPYEVMKAIEKKDIMFLMEVRDKAFPLLLQSSGGETPLVHAIRTGNKDVAIVLLGAFSRWVNYLEDSDVQKPQTQSYLKALRELPRAHCMDTEDEIDSPKGVGLKLAINEGLAKSQNELIASFMQTLIMSEGDKWVFAQVAVVARALAAGNAGKPVEVAGSSVRKFATKELGKAELIASLEDYISNATADLLMMGAWANVQESIKAETLPSYYFARDDRAYKAFIERLDRHKAEIQRTCSRRLRWQLEVLREVLEGRSVTFRASKSPLRIQTLTLTNEARAEKSRGTGFSIG